MVEIFYRGVGSAIVKRIEVPTAEVDAALRMICGSDTLELCSKPKED